jgi:hypothetical protein
MAHSDEDIDSGEVTHLSGQDVYEKSFYFAVNVELLFKN